MRRPLEQLENKIILAVAGNFGDAGLEAGFVAAGEVEPEFARLSGRLVRQKSVRFGAVGVIQKRGQGGRARNPLDGGAEELAGGAIGPANGSIFLQ